MESHILKLIETIVTQIFCAECFRICTSIVLDKQLIIVKNNSKKLEVNKATFEKIIQK